MSNNKELCEQMRCPGCQSVGNFLIGHFKRVTCGGCNKMYGSKASWDIRSEAWDVLYALELEGNRVSFPVHDIAMEDEVHMDPEQIVVDDNGYHLENCMVDYWNADLTEIYSTYLLRR